MAPPERLTRWAVNLAGDLEVERCSKRAYGEADTIAGVGGVDHPLDIRRDAEAIIQLEAEEKLDDVFNAVGGCTEAINLTAVEADRLAVDRAEKVSRTKQIRQTKSTLPSAGCDCVERTTRWQAVEVGVGEAIAPKNDHAWVDRPFSIEAKDIRVATTGSYRTDIPTVETILFGEADVGEFEVGSSTWAVLHLTSNSVRAAKQSGATTVCHRDRATSACKVEATYRQIVAEVPVEASTWPVKKEGHGRTVDGKAASESCFLVVERVGVEELVDINPSEVDIKVFADVVQVADLVDGDEGGAIRPLAETVVGEGSVVGNVARSEGEEQRSEVRSLALVESTKILTCDPAQTD